MGSNSWDFCDDTLNVMRRRVSCTEYSALVHLAAQISSEQHAGATTYILFTARTRNIFDSGAGHSTRATIPINMIPDAHETPVGNMSMEYMSRLSAFQGELFSVGSSSTRRRLSCDDDYQSPLQGNLNVRLASYGTENTGAIAPLVPVIHPDEVISLGHKPAVQVAGVVRQEPHYLGLGDDDGCTCHMGNCSAGQGCRASSE
ncbi:hypothetical protein F5Y10DRAFT_259517 [Nemania abortiva]|nr:hypothetical protein F5Y10DRAFT_259517 [Nemania abortiva]